MSDPQHRLPALRADGRVQKSVFSRARTGRTGMAKNPRDGYVRSALGYLVGRLGDARRAESEIVQALRLSPADADTRFIAALTYEALGRRQDTLAVLDASPKDVIADLNRWPEVDDLHRDPRFIQLLASHQIKQGDR